MTIRKSKLNKGPSRSLLVFALALLLIVNASPAFAAFKSFYQGTNQFTTDVAGPQLKVGEDTATGTDALFQLGSDSNNPIIFTNTGNLGNLNITAPGPLGITINGNSVYTSADASTTNVANRLVLRDLNGDFAANDVTVDDLVAATLTGIAQTAVQPNITSLGTQTVLNVSGVTTLSGNFNVNNGVAVDMGANRVSNVATGAAATDAVNVAQLNAAIAAGGAAAAQFVAAAELAMPAEADTNNPANRDLDTSTILTFPAGALAGRTLTEAVITNITPPLHFDLVNNTVRMGFQGASGGVLAGPLVTVPGTNNAIQYGIEEILPASPGQYRIRLQRVACIGLACDAAFGAPLTFQFEFFGI